MMIRPCGNGINGKRRGTFGGGGWCEAGRGALPQPPIKGGELKPRQGA